MKKDITIVYFVAGLSNRFGGKIKQLAKVGPNNETLIEYSINQAISAGFNKIILVVGNKTEVPLKKIFGNNYKGIPIHYALQKYDPTKRDKPWGTLDALCTAKRLINCPFVTCNGDDIYRENTFKILIDLLKSNEIPATVACQLNTGLPPEGSVNRAIFKIDNNGYVKELEENFNISRLNLKEKKLSLNDLCSMNLFALQVNTMDMLSDILNKFKKNHTGDRKIECLLPDALNKLIKEGKLAMKLHLTEDQWVGITNPGDENKVKTELLKFSK